MKKLLILSLALISFQSQAGYWYYSCQSADGKLTFTRDSLVLLTKEKTGAIASITTKNYNDDTNADMEAGTIYTFKDTADSTYGDVVVKLTKLVSEKEVESVEGECGDGWEGNGPGHGTTKYVFKGQVQHNDEKKNVKLTCFETFGWAGSCHPVD